jgi:thiamine biosynthesis lipoprotein
MVVSFSTKRSGEVPWRWLLTAAVTLVVTTACGQSSGPQLVRRAGLAMGSALELTAWTADQTAADEAFRAVFAEFDRLDRMMSVWKPESDIVRLNQAAGEHPVPVAAETIEILEQARKISEWTNGKFDVTFSALSDLWKFDQDQDNRIPDPQEVKRRLPLINYRDLIVDKSDHTAFLTRRGMRAHLGGIGKGYAVERSVAILRAHGLRDFMIQAGGDMYVGGRRGDRPWRLGIQDPRGPRDASFGTVELSDATFSTSGDYERAFIKDGRRYHHIIDPSTGEPARGCRSVTIVAPSATLADGLSTGVFLLGPVEGMSLIERLPGVAGVIVSAKNEVLVSKGLQDRFKLIAPPTDAP